ncbi:MAG: DUF2914 domain-containing protein [Calditrichae bacterium]|nr:DUF2914 domain-containing protein [Calditrichia bacterium]
MKILLNTNNHHLQKAIHLYNKYKRYLPVVAFFGGFSWDSLTLRRIDQLLDNLILLAYLLLIGVFIILINMTQHHVIKKQFLVKYQEWYPVIIQFLLGGLFSAYVVYYFQSATFSKTFLFVALLLILLIANEFLENRLTNLYLQSSLFFLAGFSYFIFFLPVITKHMNVVMFILGGILSLLLVIGVLYFLFKNHAVRSREQFWRVIVLVGVIYVLLNIFYWQNWIPPVPLSLKYGGIFHNVQRIEDQYQVRFEKPKWYQFYKDSDDPFHYVPGDTVYCFAAVFAPTELKKKIYHHWQYFADKQKQWITTDKLDYLVTGGRRSGYRGYTYKKNVSPGEWRVEVKTVDDQLLGRINFEIVQIDSMDFPLKTELR